MQNEEYPKLRNCPFCGGTTSYVLNILESDPQMEFVGVTEDNWQVLCPKCFGCGGVRRTADEAIEAWNRRTKIETNIYDQAETYPNCTVQVLTNTATGEVSVGWWENGGKEDGSKA